ncbi:hypothetical protein [Serratia liquefaciens]|nr:hypothetical protein [Serratia liquefaciens]
MSNPAQIAAAIIGSGNNEQGYPVSEVAARLGVSTNSLMAL